MHRDAFRSRTKGQGWAKAKIHEQLHVPDDIERNGAPQWSHTGPTEHNHIAHVKRPFQVTQKRRDVLDQQIAARVSDIYIVDSAYTQMTTDYGNKTGETLDTNFTGISKMASSGRMFIIIISI